MLGERIGVLLAAGGAGWEVEALRVLGSDPGRVVLLKRCVDLPDLLASASTGQARVAVVAGDLPGLDVESVTLLAENGVAVLLLAAPGHPAAGLPGVREVVDVAEAHRLPSAVEEAASEEHQRSGEQHVATRAGDVTQSAADRTQGRLVGVWGPTGAPGRTTVAVGVAAAAGRSTETLLVDADPYGGSVAQHLGVLDEASGLLGAARLANAGRLDPAGLAATARSVGTGLRVLTGLPRADRWPEVRETAFDTLVETARVLCPLVVADLGFCLEQSGPSFGAGAPQRNLMTVHGLDQADEVLVVGSADPVGLSRLARGLVDLTELVPAAGVRVVVNRVRPSLGWGEREVTAMVEGFVAPLGIHFLPDDLTAADRALMAGRPVSEMTGSRLAAGLAELTAAVTGTAPSPGGPRRLRLRTGGRGR